MGARIVAVTVVTVITGLVLTGCGGGLPRTQANLSVCRVFEKVVSNRAPMIELTGATLMTNAPISHQLRQDLATYIAMSVQHMPGVDQAAAKAAADCQSIGE